jgi:rubrerythrin
LLLPADRASGNGMALLKAEPPEPVRSLAGLFAVAHRFESDTAAHYAELAARIHGIGDPEAAKVFERLAGEKRAHAFQVERWARERIGTMPDSLDAPWEPRGMFGEEAAEDTPPHRLATPYRALSLAVRQEDRAFAFWTYVVAGAEDPAVRQAAAALAEEGLHRAWVLRRERRRAFHAERRAMRRADNPRATPLGVAPLERELAARLQELAAASAARGDEDGARTLRQLSADSAVMAEEAVHAFGAAATQELPASAGIPVKDGTSFGAALHLAELAFEFYLAAAEAAKDEAVLNKAQSLAERAIARAAHLGSFAV